MNTSRRMYRFLAVIVFVSENMRRIPPPHGKFKEVKEKKNKSEREPRK